MSRKILFNGKHYELVHWHFRYLEAKDEFGNKLLIKHNQNKSNLISILKAWKQKFKLDVTTIQHGRKIKL